MSRRARGPRRPQGIPGQDAPEMRVAVTHGQMPAGRAGRHQCRPSTRGKYDVLLSTTIVESGLDIPTANTLIVHRADRFGLAQLYQLRETAGGARRLCAYALLHAAGRQVRSPLQAERRLKVLQSLDTLGAGFQLAPHDLDIRGAGNLLGDEQSGGASSEVGFGALPGRCWRRRLRASRQAFRNLSRTAGRRRSASARRCPFPMSMWRTCRRHCTVSAARRSRRRARDRCLEAELVDRFRQSYRSR